MIDRVSIELAIGVGFTLVFGAFLLYIHRAADRAACEMLDDFERKFPGRCPICAFDRQARREGVYLGPTAHDCPEQKPKPGALSIAESTGELSLAAGGELSPTPRDSSGP